ncbi:MAG TPA: alpha/beta fold hydrolase [Acidimicrobiales bacterium]|nr:alpha/beta fold hydrolase [Acidimicrobiales bacterium]
MSPAPAARFGAPERFAGPDGRLAYHRTGSGSPLVLLHSLALGAEMWAGLARELASEHEVLALDLRGHGASEWSGAPFGVEELTDDVLALLDHLGHARAHLLGLSMGGSVALTLAGLAPERVERLVLCDTTAWYGEEAPKAWAERAAQAAGKPRYQQIAFQVDRWFTADFRRFHPEVVSAVTGLFLRTAPATHAEACRALGALDSRHLLAAITAPTLVITGREDYATPPAMGEAIAAGVPDGRFLVSPARHFAILESPRLREVVREHLAGRSLTVTERELVEGCCPAHSGSAAA